MPLSRDGSAEATTSRPPALLPEPSWATTASSSRPASSSSSSSSQLAARAPPTPPALVPPSAAARRRIPASFNSMAAGAGAGLVSSIVTCPLDVVKTTLQAQYTARGSQEYEGVRLTVLRIYKQSGLRGFYRGLGPTIGGYLPTWGIYFTVYDLVKDRLGTWAQRQKADVLLVHMVAAMSAGATGTVLTNPLWVVKTRFMAQAVMPPSSKRYTTTFDAVRTIYRTEGFRAFYKGLLPSLLGISHVAVQFPLYEKAKAWAASDNHGTLSPSAILLCSAFSKMVASLATYPHEVLRTRLQIAKRQTSTTSPPSSSSSSSSPSVPSAVEHRHTARPHTPLYSPLVTGNHPPVPANTADPYRQGQANGHAGEAGKWRPRKGGIVDTAIKIKRQDGWSGFYRGLSINLVRTVPSSAVTMLT